jgi:hypothetical protein
MNGYAVKLLEYFSRKFVLSLGALVGTFVLSMEGKDVGEWAAALGVILGLYISGNVAETHIATRKSPAKNSQINIEDATVNVEAKTDNG